MFKYYCNTVTYKRGKSLQILIEIRNLQTMEGEQRCQRDNFDKFGKSSVVIPKIIIDPLTTFN